METTDGSVVVECVPGGAQAKYIMGMENKGRSKYTPHLFVLDFDESGQISHVKAYWDKDTVFAQLGHTEAYESA